MTAPVKPSSCRDAKQKWWPNPGAASSPSLLEEHTHTHAHTHTDARIPFAKPRHYTPTHPQISDRCCCCCCCCLLEHLAAQIWIAAFRCICISSKQAMTCSCWYAAGLPLTGSLAALTTIRLNNSMWCWETYSMWWGVLVEWTSLKNRALT